MPIRVSLGHVDEYDDTVADFALQLGLTSIQLHSPTALPGHPGHWTVEELRALRERVAARGLTIDGLENVPAAHFWKVQAGLPGRDEQLDHYCRTIRNMAEAGYDLLGHHWMPTYVWRTDMSAAGRGGAAVTGFDLDAAAAGNALATYRLTPEDALPAPLSAEQMWANYSYFLDAVLPVAEEVGVRLSLHPDDPPVDEPLGGAARIFATLDGLTEGLARAGGSPMWGVTLCLGTVSERGGAAAVDAAIDLLGPLGRIFYVHFRDVRGTVPRFTECFLGEGNLDPARVLRRLRDRGFDGFVIDDHVPAMVGDGATWGDTSPAAYCSRGRAHAIGYLTGILNALASEDEERA